MYSVPPQSNPLGKCTRTSRITERHGYLVSGGRSAFRENSISPEDRIAAPRPDLNSVPVQGIQGYLLGNITIS